MNIEILKLSNNDQDKFSALLDVYETVFEMEKFKKPPVNYLVSLLANSQLIVYVALAGNEVVGGLTAYVLPSVYLQSAEVYVYDLAVKTVCQRQGIGTKLMEAINTHCAKNGLMEAFVQADIADKHAVDFYKRIKGKGEKVMHFSFPVK